MVSQSFAQSSRDGTPSEGKTTFTSIAVRGLNKAGTDGRYTTGLPGYIEMTSTAGNVYYLFVGYDGKLRIASDIAVGYLASPATVGWADGSAPLVQTQK